MPLLVILVTFLPILASLLSGYAQVPQAYLDLLTSMRAGRLRTFRRATLPAARPSFFAGLRISATYAIVARDADQVFTVQSGIDEARAFRTEIRRLAAEAGRSPDAVQVLPGVVPFVAATAEEAEAALSDLTRRIGMVHIVPKLERFTGLTLDGLDPDAPLPYGPDDLSETTFSNSRARLLICEAHRAGMTLRQLAARFAAGRGHLLLVGTGRDAAETMRRWIDEGAADGFNVIPPLLPAGRTEGIRSAGRPLPGPADIAGGMESHIALGAFERFREWHSSAPSR